MSNRARSPADLDSWATHVGYEIRVLVEQTVKLKERLPTPTPIRPNMPIEAALLEAALVHIRLLDDFFLTKSHSTKYDDLIARDWLPSWKPRTILDKTTKKQIGKRVAHFSRVRGTDQDWDLVSLTGTSCAVLSRFLEELEVADPQRAQAFVEARDAVALWQRTLPHLQDQAYTTESISSSPPGPPHSQHTARAE